MRLTYADPPYPGRAHLYADHPDYAGEVDHEHLIRQVLSRYDGWALSTSAAALQEILPLCPPDIRVLAWVKHSVNVSWEPVIVKSARPIPTSTLRDWIHVEPEAFQWRPKPDSYVIGQKPGPFCTWLFQWLGASYDDDVFDDLFPGSGAVKAAWNRFREQPPLFPSERRIRRERERMLAEHPTLTGDAT